MLKLFQILKFMLASAAVMTLPQYATAQTVETCPAGTDQRLYTLIENIQAGQNSNASELAALAQWAVESCPTRMEVQGMALVLYGALLRSSNDLDVVSGYVTQTDKAFTQMTHQWTANHEWTSLVKADGSPANYYATTRGGPVVAKTMLPILVALAARGNIHPLLSGTPLKVCPYPKSHQSSLEDEGEFWEKPAHSKFGQPVFQLAADRLRTLRDACPEHAYDLNYYLARHYGEPVFNLTDFEKKHSGMGMFGQDMYEYRLRANGQLYSTESGFEEALAEFAAQARPLSKHLRGYIAAYETASEAERLRSERDDSFRERKYLEKTRNPRNAQVRKWKKAAASLEPQ